MPQTVQSNILVVHIMRQWTGWISFGSANGFDHKPSNWAGIALLWISSLVNKLKRNPNMILLQLEQLQLTPAFWEYPMPPHAWYPDYQFISDPLHPESTFFVVVGGFLGFFVFFGFFFFFFLGGGGYNYKSMNLAKPGICVKGYASYYICIKFESSSDTNGLMNAKKVQITNKNMFEAVWKCMFCSDLANGGNWLSMN